MQNTPNFFKRKHQCDLSSEASTYFPTPILLSSNRQARLLFLRTWSGQNRMHSATRYALGVWLTLCKLEKYGTSSIYGLRYCYLSIWSMYIYIYTHTIMMIYLASSRKWMEMVMFQFATWKMIPPPLDLHVFRWPSGHFEPRTSRPCGSVIRCSPGLLEWEITEITEITHHQTITNISEKKKSTTLINTG